MVSGKDREDRPEKLGVLSSVPTPATEWLGNVGQVLSPPWTLVFEFIKMERLDDL